MRLPSLLPEVLGVVGHCPCHVATGRQDSDRGADPVDDAGPLLEQQRPHRSAEDEDEDERHRAEERFELPGLDDCGIVGHFGLQGRDTERERVAKKTLFCNFSSVSAPTGLDKRKR